PSLRVCEQLDVVGMLGKGLGRANQSGHCVDIGVRVDNAYAAHGTLSVDHNSRDMGDWREQWLDLSIACGVAVVVVTESLGAFSWLSTWAVRFIWLAWLVVMAAVVLRRRRCTRSNLQEPGSSLGLSSRIVLAGLACIVILVGISALCAPPNAIDALNYHMSRVANWQQRPSVDAYATGYLPQL